jgi:transitional endoplasmic reticulum ATPase
MKEKVVSGTEVEIVEHFKGFVFDGAIAFQKAMNKMFGSGEAVTTITEGFFGEYKEKPKMIKVEVGAGKSILVPWGKFRVPGIEGFIHTGCMADNEKVLFGFMAVVHQKHAQQIHELAELTQQYLKEESIYRGKSFRVKFYSEHGERFEFPKPSFIDTTHTQRNNIIFSDELAKNIEANLYTVIEKSELCRKHHIPLKRGILLAGTYGVGKTLVAYATAKVCTDNKWTFIMAESAAELKSMVELARDYQPAVVFCEDIDRVVGGDERTEDMDSILNVIDGIESKDTEIMVVLTTNNVESIHPAMIRPGRLDAVITVVPPDTEAVEKLIRLYGSTMIPKGTDLKEVSRKLTGNIPAVIRECVERAKLYSFARGDKEPVIDGEALVHSEASMTRQLELLKHQVITKKVTPEESVGIIFKQIIEGAQGDVKQLRARVDNVITKLDKLIR